jgi:hypothetical protein
MKAQQGHSNKTGGSNSIGNSNNNPTTANELKITSAAIEQARQYDVGTEAK